MGRWDEEKLGTSDDNPLKDSVLDPETNEIINLNKLKEKELLDLMVRLAEKSKKIRTKHKLRHGYLMAMGKVLRRLYTMNVHRWALDEGWSKERIEEHDKYFKEKL